MTYVYLTTASDLCRRSPLLALLGRGAGGRSLHVHMSYEPRRTQKHAPLESSYIVQDSLRGVT
jgi:hypothetical protein